MDFTVFTSAGGFREFLGDSTYDVGEHNGCLYVVDGASGQVVTYGPNAWSSVQEWQREGQIVPPAGEGRRPAAKATGPDELDELLEAESVDQGLVVVAAIEQDPEPAKPRHFDPLFDPLESFAEQTGR